MLPNIDIQVDGGIVEETAIKTSRCGANSFVSGSGIFAAKDKKQTIEKMKKGAHDNYMKL